MFRRIAEKTRPDPELPARAWWLAALGRVLDGSFYDVLAHPFDEEKNGAGEYVALKDRRPAVRCNICRVVVEDSVGFVFGEGRFPAVLCDDEPTRAALAGLIDESGLAEAMNEAALAGSIGSVVVLMRVLKGRLFWEVMPSTFLTPVYDPAAPDTLARLTERYKATGKELRAAGFAIAAADDAAEFWFQREWGGEAETWFLPQKVGETGPPAIDDGRTVRHGLGFVPAVWIKNLPGGVAPDGWCTFRPAIEDQIEIDYQLSQAGRGLKYSSDPTLLIKEPAGDGELVKGGGNALVVSEKGDAKLLEIGGTAASAVIEYVRCLREFALEAAHGNRTSPEKMATAQSGRAVELMNGPLIMLADKLRLSYGARGLLLLLRMVVAAAGKYALTLGGAAIPRLSAAPLSLKWQPWAAPTEGDKLQQAQGLGELRKSGHISRATAVAAIAANYDIANAATEVAAVEADEAAADMRAAKAGAAVTSTETEPG